MDEPSSILTIFALFVRSEKHTKMRMAVHADAVSIGGNIQGIGMTPGDNRLHYEILPTASPSAVYLPAQLSPAKDYPTPSLALPRLSLLSSA